MDTKHLNQLFILLQEGKMEYFDEFYELTKRGVFSASYAVLQNQDLAENILQETYLKFLEKLPTLKREQSILAYLMKTAQNLSINEKKKNRRLRYDVDVSQIGKEDEKNEDALIYETMRKVLNKTEQQIVILHAVEEMTHQEIANELGKPLGTITWAYNNALKKLRKALENEGY